MRVIMKKFILLAVMALSCLSVYANCVEIDGIYYNLTSKIKAAEVTWNPNESYYYKGAVSIPKSVIYEGISYSVIGIGKSAFDNCRNLTSVTIPNSVTGIGAFAFSGCSSLSSIKIPESVAVIDASAFKNCNSLKKVIVSDLSKWCCVSFGDYDANPLSSAHHLFSDESTEILDLVIPDGPTSLCKSFCGCSSLTSVTLPYSVTNIGDNAFARCTGLTSFNIPSNVKNLGNHAFYGCVGLTSVTVPGGVTSIGFEAFSGCNSLTSITICNGVTSIGEWAFQYCGGVKSITIPNSVASVRRGAFQYCRGLTSVTIGNGVKEIRDDAFANCPELTDVYCYAEDVPSTGNNLFENSYIEYATLHVISSALDVYRTASPWKNFGRIVSIEDGDEPEIKICATPTIGYADGKLTFKSETKDAICISNITNSDISSFSGNEVLLNVTYHISVYATKAGYDNSEVATATLCWIDAEPRTEGIFDEDAVSEIKSLPILIQSNGSNITVQGAAEGTEITAYDVNGILQDTVIASKGSITLNTSILPGSVAIVKIGDKIIKVMIR